MQQAWIAFLCSRPQQKPNSAMSYANSEPIPLHLIATHFTKLHKILAITSASAEKKIVSLAFVQYSLDDFSKYFLWNLHSN